jgi:hypothetical protein
MHDTHSSHFHGAWQTKCIPKLLRYIHRLHRIVSGSSLQASPRHPQTPPAALHKEYLQTQRLLIRKMSHIPTVPLTKVHSHTQYLMFFIIHLFKQQQGKSRLVPTPWWVVCVQCWSLNGISWESRAGLLSQSGRVSTGLVFMNRGRLYLHIFRPNSHFSVKVSERVASRANVKSLDHFFHKDCIELISHSKLCLDNALQKPHLISFGTTESTDSDILCITGYLFVTCFFCNFGWTLTIMLGSQTQHLLYCPQFPLFKLILW